MDARTENYTWVYTETNKKSKRISQIRNKGHAFVEVTLEDFDGCAS